jgi:4-alpha-glucanotransferase
MYRIDHFVGLFRIWVTSNSDNEHYGSFLPKEEYLWEAHGKKIIDVMVNSSSMLPCAEDLGTVPSCSYHVLQEYGITGIDFQRYYKNNFEFIPPEHYRINSAAVLSTHDSSFWINWWQFEAGTIDELLFEILCNKIGFDQLHVIKLKRDLFDENKSNNGRLYWKDEIFTADILLNILNIDYTKAQSFIYLYLESYMEKTKYLNFLHKYTNYTQNNYDLNFQLIYNTLRLINNTKSIFSIQLLQDYLALDENILKKIGKYNVRINTPGSINKNNWSRIIPVSLENLLSLEINSEIYNIVRDSNRL